MVIILLQLKEIIKQHTEMHRYCTFKVLVNLTESRRTVGECGNLVLKSYKVSSLHEQAPQLYHSKHWCAKLSLLALASMAVLMR